MATEPIRWREPESIASGDTLVYQRNLPIYLPSDGWGINGGLTKATDKGGQLAAQFQSQPDATNSYHCVNVPNFGAGLDDGIYIFSEEIVNSNTQEKHQIYYADNFLLSADLTDGLAIGNQLTEAQIGMQECFKTYLKVLRSKFQETDVQRNLFVEKKLIELRNELNYWKAQRLQEIQFQNVRNGKPSGAISQPLFQIG
jgi:hypothetical protein